MKKRHFWRRFGHQKRRFFIFDFAMVFRDFRLFALPLGLETCLYKELDEKGVEVSGGEAGKYYELWHTQAQYDTEA